MPTQDVTTVYVMRHGQTAYNVDDRIRGRADPDLNDTGRAQAQALAKLMAGIPLARVIASPLQRAVHTAGPTAVVAKLPVETYEGLSDRDYGLWTGELRSKVDQLFGSVDAAPGVESTTTLQKRVLATFNRLIATSPGPAILLVGHDATNRVLLAGLNPELGATPQDNGCWNKLIRADGCWKIVVMNALPGDGHLP